MNRGHGEPGNLDDRLIGARRETFALCLQLPDETASEETKKRALEIMTRFKNDLVAIR